MRVLITGGGGFLGSALVSKLSRRKGIQLAVLDAFVHGFPRNLPKKKNIDAPVVGNIRNYYDIYRLMDRFRPDVVYHLASHITRPESVGNFRTCSEVNYVGTANLIDSCVQLKESGPKKIIYASGESARSPVSHFGISKLASENLLEALCPDMGISIATLRLAEIYGPSIVNTSASVTNFLIDHVVKNEPVALFGPNKKKDHVYIDDAVRALELSLDTEFKLLSKVDIGTGEAIKMSDLAQLIKKLSASSTVFKFIDSPYVRVVDSVSDTKIAKEVLGFETEANFDETLAAYVLKRKKDLK